MADYYLLSQVVSIVPSDLMTWWVCSLISLILPKYNSTSNVSISNSYLTKYVNIIPASQTMK